MMMMQVAQLSMSLGVTNENLKENANQVSFVHLGSVLFKGFSFKNSEVLLVRFCSILLKVYYVAYSLFSCYRGYVM